MVVDIPPIVTPLRIQLLNRRIYAYIEYNFRIIKDAQLGIFKVCTQHGCQWYTHRDRLLPISYETVNETINNRELNSNGYKYIHLNIDRAWQKELLQLQHLAEI